MIPVPRTATRPKALPPFWEAKLTGPSRACCVFIKEVAAYVGQKVAKKIANSLRVGHSLGLLLVALDDLGAPDVSTAWIASCVAQRASLPQ
jgi:hypothetical protein